MIRCWLALTYYLYALRLIFILIHYNARGFKNRQKSSLHLPIRSAGCFFSLQNQPFSPSFSAANFAFMVGFLRTNLFTVKSSALLFASRRLFSEFSSAALVFSS